MSHTCSIFLGEMTEKLYLVDSYLRETKARVVGIEKLRGRRAYIFLDKTIFHPLYGGQPSDRGEIMGSDKTFRVKKVIVKGNELLHYGSFEEKYLFEPGEEVLLRLDWAHRFLVMRLHTAGHILDFAVAKVHGRLVETLSAFHGPPRAYLEYALDEEPKVEDILIVANEVVKRNLPVRVRFVGRDELENAIYNAPNLGRLPEAEKYRIVEIPGVNAMPCTGTHVMATGEVGRVVAEGVEKTDRGWRIFYNIV